MRVDHKNSGAARAEEKLLGRRAAIQVHGGSADLTALAEGLTGD
jgi:hypothetical protein